MTTYQEKRICELLDRMAGMIVDRRDAYLHDTRVGYETLGGLEYDIWEARQTVGLPDYPGLHPT